MALHRNRRRFLGVVSAAALVACVAAVCGVAWPRGWVGAPGRSSLAGLGHIARRAAGEVEFYTMDMCPYAQRTWIALEEKGIKYTRKLVDFRDETAKAWYKENINPLGKVPSIKDTSDGTVIYESEIINEYLDQRFAGSGPELMPRDAAGCAAVRLWNNHLNSKLAPAHFTFLMNKDPEKETEQQKALEEAMEHYEKNLAGPYLVGDQFTLADVSALPFFERLTYSLLRFKNYEMPVSLQRLREWLALVNSRPSFIATKRPDDKLEEVYQKFLDMNYKFAGLNKN
mmetsp:Transcript_40055/g.101754  ORF Transcript_40055/g.101754 Transcript_40055/m.101754 type:complete len:285 (-) Transcript_40055:535-1389(-)